MVDIVVRRADGPDVILTLDKRFVETPTLELLHTSASTVVRKVTRIWPGEDDFVNLHRQSVTSLMPGTRSGDGVGECSRYSQHSLAASMPMRCNERRWRLPAGQPKILPWSPKPAEKRRIPLIRLWEMKSCLARTPSQH